MRVLYVIDSLGVGGAEKSLFEITTRLNKFSPIVTHLFDPDTLAGQFHGAGVPVSGQRLHGKYAITGSVQAVLRSIRTHTPDLVHSSLYRADFAARIACWLAGVPLVTSLVNDSYARHRFASAPISLRAKYKFVQGLDRLLSPLTYRFVANSRAVAVANQAALGIPSAKVTVIYRGRDPAMFARSPEEDKAQLRQQLKLPPDARVGLCVGRLIETKGHIDLIRAVHAMGADGTNFVMLIAGEGPLRPQLERLIAELQMGSSVRLLGQRHDVPALLQLADLFVFPSTVEGLPGAVVEAMLACVPIVASDYVVHRELIDEGETGWLVPSHDVGALAGRISWALSHPDRSQSMAKRAHAVAVEKFDIRKIVQRHEELYTDVLCEWQRR